MGCDCVSYHTPLAMKPHRHHIVPKSWGGTNVPGNIVTICPTTHDNVHDLLNYYIDFQGLPPWQLRRQYNKFTRELAARAWAARPSDSPPRTGAY